MLKLLIIIWLKAENWLYLLSVLRGNSILNIKKSPNLALPWETFVSGTTFGTTNVQYLDCFYSILAAIDIKGTNSAIQQRSQLDRHQPRPSHWSCGSHLIGCLIGIPFRETEWTHWPKWHLPTPVSLKKETFRISH